MERVAVISFVHADSSAYSALVLNVRDFGETVAHARWVTGKLGVPGSGRPAKVGGCPA